MSSNYVSRKKEIYATNVHYEGTERTNIKKGRARIKNLTLLAICPQLDKQHQSVTKNNVSLAYNRDLTAFNLRVSANFHEKWREQLRF